MTDKRGVLVAAEKLKHIIGWILGICALSTLLPGCATNAMTGRAQLSLMSKQEVQNKSAGYYRNMLGSLPKGQRLIAGRDINTRIDKITNRLIQQAVLYHPESAKWDWKVSVIDDDKTINAFCMPGGLMAIYSGLPNKLDATDDEIAQVMGHEIGHALAGHSAEKMSVQMAADMAVLAASVAIAVADGGKNNDLTTMALTTGSMAFINLPNSRTTEVEADRIGIELAARAGYNPAAAVTLWQKMAKANTDHGRADFFSTHPAPERRQDNLRALAAPLNPLYLTGKGNSGTPPFDWLHGEKYKRPSIAAGDAIAFYSEAWEKFKAGLAVLDGNNLPMQLLKQSDFAKLYQNGHWRDLAVQVMDTNYQLDLGYFYLAKAAEGLGFSDAAQAYKSRTLELGQDEDFACAKKKLLSC